MVRTILFSVVVVVCFSCSVGKNAIGEIGIRQFAGYTYKKAIPAMGNLEYRVIEEAAEFEKLFSGDAIGISNPDFRGQMVIAIVKGVDNSNTSILYHKAEVKGKTMRVVFDVDNSRKYVDETNTVLAIVPRVTGLTSIDFYKGNQLVATVTR
jgi:hypothetical protein